LAVSALVRAELARHDWSRLRCGCGSTAGHVPEIFEKILAADSAGDAVGYALDGHLEVETNLFEVAVPAVGVILAALAGPISEFSRGQLIAVLWYMVSGESHSTEVALGRSRLGDECRLKAREGIWIIFHYAVNRRDETAMDIVGLIDLDEDRSGYYASRIA
jgi:hypothetical protein